MDTDALLLRYQRFYGFELGVLPRQEWKQFLPDLLPYEESFWYGQPEIGLFRDCPFRLDVINPTPFAHRPITYP